MIIKTAQFVMSNTDISKCPKPEKPEYAFIGRSNVGKSSLINMLTNHSKLAKTSGKPGKTQLINHFIINEEWYLVDLPGYGYAKVSKKDRSLWKGFIKDYITNRENLMCLFVLLDSRIPAQDIDLNFMFELSKNQVPFVIVFTKTDKLTKNELAKNIAIYRKVLAETWEPIPTNFISSAPKKVGEKEILEFIEQTNKLFS